MREGYRCTHRHAVWGRCALLGGHAYRRSPQVDPVLEHAAAIAMGELLVVQRWDDDGADWPEPDLVLADLPWAEVRVPVRRGPRGAG
jgi:hypothetical protein